jgi:hypothetical protein
MASISEDVLAATAMVELKDVTNKSLLNSDPPNHLETMRIISEYSPESFLSLPTLDLHSVDSNRCDYMRHIFHLFNPSFYE